MQQSQIISTCILSEGCGEKIVCIDIKKEGGRDRSLRDAVSLTSKPALLAINGGQDEASVSDKF